MSGGNSVTEDICSSVRVVGDSMGCVGLISMMGSSEVCLVDALFGGGLEDDRRLLSCSRFRGSPPRLRRTASAKASGSSTL